MCQEFVIVFRQVWNYDDNDLRWKCAENNTFSTGTCNLVIPGGGGTGGGGGGTGGGTDGNGQIVSWNNCSWRFLHRNIVSYVIDSIINIYRFSISSGHTSSDRGFFHISSFQRFLILKWLISFQNGNPGTGNSGIFSIYWDILQLLTNFFMSLTGSSLQLTNPAGSGLGPQVQTQSTCATFLERCCPPFGYACGLRYPPVGEFEWIMVTKLI